MVPSKMKQEHSLQSSYVFFGLISFALIGLVTLLSSSFVHELHQGRGFAGSANHKIPMPSTFLTDLGTFLTLSISSICLGTEVISLTSVFFSLLDFMGTRVHPAVPGVAAGAAQPHRASGLLKAEWVNLCLYSKAASQRVPGVRNTEGKSLRSQ